MNILSMNFTDRDPFFSNFQQKYLVSTVPIKLVFSYHIEYYKEKIFLSSGLYPPICPPRIFNSSWSMWLLFFSFLKVFIFKLVSLSNYINTRIIYINIWLSYINTWLIYILNSIYNLSLYIFISWKFFSLSSHMHFVFSRLFLSSLSCHCL